MKTKLKSKRPKLLATKSRQSLPKQLAEQRDLGKKFNIAAGQALLGFSFFGTPKTHLDVFAFRRRVEILSEWVLEKNLSDLQRKELITKMASLGLFVMGCLADKNHLFFSRLAAVIQYDRKPAVHKTYALICDYCLCNECGTAERPCDGKALAKYLMERGTNFSGYENQVPRVLRAMCRKIGIVLAGQR